MVAIILSALMILNLVLFFLLYRSIKPKELDTSSRHEGLMNVEIVSYRRDSDQVLLMENMEQESELLDEGCEKHLTTEQKGVDDNTITFTTTINDST